MSSSSPPNLPRIDVVLPVHNEADGIEAVIEEIFAALDGHLDVRVVVSEDGSVDGTRAVLARVAQRRPLIVTSQEARRGYAGAVLAGLAAAETDWIVSMDADGQCNPADILSLWAARENADVVMGWRRTRRDGIVRRTISAAFALIYRRVFDVTVTDPSCPLVMLRREPVVDLLPSMGCMPYGWWWEFIATARWAGLRIAEVAVDHRTRTVGQSQVFVFTAVPRLIPIQIASFVRLWFSIRRLKAEKADGATLP